MRSDYTINILKDLLRVGFRSTKEEISTCFGGTDDLEMKRGIKEDLEFSNVVGGQEDLERGR